MSYFIRQVLASIVSNLITGNYTAIMDASAIKRCSAEDISHELSTYPGVMTDPPESAYEDLLVIDIDDSNEQLVHFDLWFEGNKADLQILVLVNETLGNYSFWDILVP
ncbi:DUF7668 domain-containing protein [Spirosoma areae]